MAQVEQINTPDGPVWRVCVDGVCREHQQQWQADVFYHQMLNNPTAPAADLDECQDAQNL